MRTYTMRCDICGEVTTLPANSEQRPEGWGTFIYRSPSQGDIEKDVCPCCAQALERNETVYERRIINAIQEGTPIPAVNEEPAVLITGEEYLTNEGTEGE